MLPYNHHTSVVINEDICRDVYQLMDIVSTKLKTEKIEHQFEPPDRGMEQVRVELMNEELWDRFQNVTTEMIVTKAGRRMFPKVKVNVNGLDPASLYAFALEFHQLGDSRWKYSNSSWTQIGKCEQRPSREQSIYVHQSSPGYGNNWMEKAVEFDKVKITNKPSSKGFEEGHILLNSLHQYVTQVHVIKLNPGHQWSCKSFPLPKTAFIAVTAYQNGEVTELKVKWNPFAKGFDGKNKQKRSNPKHEEESEAIYCDPNGPERWSEVYHQEHFTPTTTYTPFSSAERPNDIGTWPHHYLEYSDGSINGQGGPIRSSLCARSSGPYGMPYGSAKYVFENVQITDA